MAVADTRIGAWGIERMRRWRRILARIPATLWLAALTQTAFLIAFAATDAYDTARTSEVLRLAATYTTLFSLFGLVHVLFGSRARWPAFVLFVSFVALNFARYETTGTFDYGFAFENV